MENGKIDLRITKNRTPEHGYDIVQVIKKIIST